MRLAFAAMLAMTGGTSLGAQNTIDLSTAAPVAGDWTYSATADGSEAVFSNETSSQLWVHCTRATRRVTIAKSASAAAAFLNVWTSSLTKAAEPSFNPATGRLTIELAPFDPLLDAIASSRGRIGFTVASQPALVVPAWAEAVHVIEDCRA